MNREIKFRVWDGERMHPSDTCGFMLSSDGELTDGINYPPGLTPLQFTGLYDRVGKEIYEGDILEVTTPHTFGGLGVVQYLDGGFWIETPRGDRQMPSQDYRRVIGNIYENADRVSRHQGRIVVLAHV